MIVLLTYAAITMAALLAAAWLESTPIVAPQWSAVPGVLGVALLRDPGPIGFFIPGMPQTQVSFPLFALGVVSIAVFDTMLYLRTGAKLLLAILVNTCWPTSAAVLPPRRTRSDSFSLQKLSWQVSFLATGARDIATTVS